MALSPEWKMFIDEEMKKDYMKSLVEFVSKRRKETHVFPCATDIFNAFIQCSYHDLKVVILGNEPYCGMGESNGLAYSSMSHKRPQSLENIYKEIFSDAFNGTTGGISVSQHNNLAQWAWQGVLLLNSILTVEENKPGSHIGKGWEQFTEATIRMINMHHYKLVFMLWGPEAQKYKKLINADKHLVLEAGCPGRSDKFIGCKHFSKSTNFLKKNYFNVRAPISWGVFEKTNHIIR